MTAPARVIYTMKNFAFVLLLVACGPKHSSNVGNSTGSGSGEDPYPGPVKDTRTEIEKRRDAACDTLGPRITTCAHEDAKADYAAGKVGKAEYEKNTAPEVLNANTKKFIEACRKAPYSSRQVRVLEVCQKEESECGPLLSCLDNLNQQ
jgi:hypothetical protein